MTRALAAVVATGIALAAAVLWQANRHRLWRVALVILGTYGAAAFVYAAVTGLTLENTLSGAGLLRGLLPRALQSAFVGAFLVLPIAWIVSVVRAGIRRFRHGSFRRALSEAVALTLCLALVVTAMPRRSPVTPVTPVTPVINEESTRTTAERIATLDEALRAIEEGDREAPRDRWDPDYVAKQLRNDPDAIYAWVRDNTFWIPYRGALRGPVGVLMDRQGNSLDRSLLLATLLQKAGHAVRLARGQVDRTVALDILSAYEHEPQVHAEPVGGPDLETVAATYHLEGPSFEPTLRAQSNRLTSVLEKVDDTVSGETRRLLALLPKSGGNSSARRDAAIAALQDHWWVQVRGNDGWRDLDPIAPGGAGALVPLLETRGVDEIDAAMYARIGIRVVVEHCVGGAIREDRVIDYEFQPSAHVGAPVVLQFWPSDWTQEPSVDRGPGAFRTRALSQRQWTAALSIGADVVAQGTVGETGEVRNDSGNPLSGLGSALADALGPANAPRESGQLTGVWIEYATHSIGEPVRTIRREVFDLLGPAVRAAGAPRQMTLDQTDRLNRSLSLMSRIEILATPCQLAPEFVSHLAVESLIGNRALLSTLAGRQWSEDPSNAASLIEGAKSPVSPLYLLALSRLEWGRFSDRTYIDRPVILSRHRFPALSRDAIVFRDATDIVANEVAVDLTVGDDFSAKVEQGVLDTAAEWLLQSGPVSGNAAADFAVSRGDWTALDLDHIGELETLRVPRNVRERMLQDLKAGRIVVARKPDSGNAGGPVVWWRVDSRTGDTLGVAENGWGQAMTERSAQNSLAVRMVKGFAFDYAFCQAVPQAVNAASILLADYRIPWLPEAKNPSDVYAANTRSCLIAAMVTTAITATLPLVLYTLRCGQMARLGVRACFVAGTLVETSRGSLPIEDIRTGDSVLGRDPSTGRQCYKRVGRTFVTLRTPVLNITTRNAHGTESILSATGDHPLWVLKRGWVLARDLRPGDLLSTADSRAVEILGSTASAPTTVYNFEVEDVHDYFVGTDRVLVHNGPCWLARLWARLGDDGIEEFIWSSSQTYSRLGTKQMVYEFEWMARTPAGRRYLERSLEYLPRIRPQNMGQIRYLSDFEEAVRQVLELPGFK